MDNIDHQSQLEASRRAIDKIDHQLFQLLAQRMEIVKEIGRIKHKAGLEVRDPVREALLKAKLKEGGASVMESRHIEELADVIIRISRDLQATS